MDRIRLQLYTGICGHKVTCIRVGYFGNCTNLVILVLVQGIHVNKFIETTTSSED